ncbi:MAG: DMT family transporter [Eubacterium sp.]|nr:DMT family transporter [Eubacterium sp.]
MNSKNAQNYILIVTTALFWGLSFVAMNALLDWLEPAQILAGRWTLAAACFAVILLVKRHRIEFRGKSIRFLLLTGLAEPVLEAFCETNSLRYVSPSICSIFIATVPCVALIIGMLVFHKKTNQKGIFSIIIAFSGVLVCTMFSPDFAAGGSFQGYLLLICAVTFAAVYGFFSNRASEGFSTLEITAVMAFEGCVSFNLIALLTGHGLDTYVMIVTNPQVLVPVALLGIFCSCVCYACCNQVMKTMNIALANNMISCLVTVVGVIAGITIAGDPAGWYTAVGLALTLTGVWLSSRAEEESA